MTKIEWTRGDDGTPGETWNPVTGCTRISEGCEHCYIERTPPMRMAHRRFDGTHIGATTGVMLHPERLDQPLHWRRSRRVFVNSMSDLFHDDIPDEFIARIWAAMALAPWHKFQILTKRPARMRSLLSSDWFVDQVGAIAEAMPGWPLPHVWLGVSVESQKWAEIRIPQLLGTPASVRWISAEPLLGPIDLDHHLFPDVCPSGCGCRLPDDGDRSECACDGPCADWRPRPALDWVVVGGETGPGARAMDPDWPRSLRDQCVDARVPYFFKQWGDWAPTGVGLGMFRPPEQLIGPPLDDMGHRQIVRRVGKKRAGRELDGREWNEYPTEVSA